MSGAIQMPQRVFGGMAMSRFVEAKYPEVLYKSGGVKNLTTVDRFRHLFPDQRLVREPRIVS